MTDTLPSWRRLLNAVVISSCFHLLLLISILEGYGGRSGPFSLPGIVMVELVPSGFRASDTIASVEPTPFPAPSLTNLGAAPAPIPSLTSFASPGDQRVPAAKRTDDEEVSGGDRPGFKSGRGVASAAALPEPSVPPAEAETGAGRPRRPGAAEGAAGPESRGPRCASCPDPDYPGLALKRGLEGEVVLNVQVLDDGRVGDIFVEKSSGYPLLDEAALTAVKGWSFYPAADRERPIAATLTVKVPFRLTPP
jgi:protein TonB